MKKTVICIVLLCSMLITCGAASASPVSTPSLEKNPTATPRPTPSEPPASTAPIMPEIGSALRVIVDTFAGLFGAREESPLVLVPESALALAEAPVQPTPEPKRLPAPKAMPTQEPGPEKYTMEWARRYAPGSCAPYEEQVGDNGEYPEEVERPPSDTYRIVVDYHNQAVWAYSRDINGDYTVLERVMICTTGGNGDWTPEGTYKMDDDYHRFGYFPSFNCYAQYWTQMWGNFYFHSVLYSSRDASSLSKSSYNGLGTPGSHGCIRMLVPDARWLYENCAPGTLCEVTTVFPRDEQLKSILKHGVEGAIDYVEEEELEELEEQEVPMAQQASGGTTPGDSQNGASDPGAGNEDIWILPEEATAVLE